MEHSFLKQAANFLRDKKNHKRYIAVFLCMALVVSLGTVMALKVSGQAQNHTEKVLACDWLAHVHTEDCYDENGVRVCGYADQVVHTHNDDCYDAAGVLVCQLPEMEAHTHDETCYEEQRALICGLEESEGHVHTAECYTRERGELTCELPESDGHIHTEECYTREQGELICELPEHTHDETCLDENGEVVCGVEEHTHSDECYDWVEALTCGLEEAHIHNDDCYGWTETLTCQIPEGEGAHTHTDECYAATGEMIITCGKYELHTHTDECYGLDENGKTVLTCTLPEVAEHVHGEGCFKTVELTGDEVGGFGDTQPEQPAEPTPCYDAEGNLICELPEHTHVGSCIDERGEFGCGLVEHTHIPYTAPEPVSCYDDEGNLICGKEEHTHTDECFELDENGEKVLDENGEPVLICGMEEHTHIAPKPEEKIMTYEDEQVIITAAYTDEACIPDGAELIAYPVTAETAPERYDQRLEEALDAVNAAPGPAETIGLEGESVPEEETPPPVLIYNIGFYVDGEEIEPAAPVTITIQFLDAQGFAVGSPITVVHFSDEGSQTITGTEVDENGSTSFVADGFSDYAIIGVNYALNTFYISSPADWYKHKDNNDADPHKMQTGTYFLQNDITVYKFQVLAGRECVIDLNGHTLNLENGGWVEVRGTLTIKDSSSGKNGKVKTSSDNNRLINIFENGIVYLDGGTATNNWHGGAVYLGDNAKLYIRGGRIADSYGNIGTGVYAEHNATITISGGGIYNNQADQTGGGIYAQGNVKITINGGEISNNHAEQRGGGIYAAGNVQITVNGGEISHNESKTSEWNSGGGGGIYINSHGDGGTNGDTATGSATLTINGGKISNNTSIVSGGGIRADYSKVLIYGGEISGNTTRQEGGGIALMLNSQMVINPTRSNVFIKNNKKNANASGADETWGGGGIFVMGARTDENLAPASKAVIVNAIIRENRAGGFGGGFSACSTGEIFFGTSPDGDPLAAIYDNTASGTYMSGSSSKKQEDKTAHDNSTFMRYGYQDVYSALKGAISYDMLGGGNESWVGSANGYPITGGSGFVYADQMLGLTSLASQEDINKVNEYAGSNKCVFIEDNESHTHGGGIMCNGLMSLGWSAVLEDGAGMQVKGQKKLTVTNGISLTSNIPPFTFSLSEEMPVWETDHWEALRGAGVMRSANSTSGSFVFDIPFDGDAPCLKTEVAAENTTYTKTFYLWESADGIPGMTYDNTLYKLVVTVKKDTTSESFYVDGNYVSLKTEKYRAENVEVSVSKNGDSTFSTFGNYRFTDEEVYTHGKLQTTGRKIVTLSGDTYSNTWNDPNVNAVKIVKESDSGQPVAGAQFELYKWDNQIFNERNWQSGGHWYHIDIYSSASDGVIYSDSNAGTGKLAAGTYRLVETAAPEGYRGLTTYAEFEVVEVTVGTQTVRTIRCIYDNRGSRDIKATPDGSTMVLHIPNTAVTGTLKMVKYGKQQVGGTEKVLEGAEFSLYADTAKATKLWTAKSGTDGVLMWTRADGSGETCGELTLEYGTYYLFEESAPSGYSLIDPYVVVNVDAEGVVHCTLNDEQLDLDGDAFKLVDESEPYSLPETGGSGSAMYTLGGCALIMMASALLYKTKISGRRKSRG